MSHLTCVKSLALVVLLSPAAATAQVNLDQPGEDYSGKHTFPPNTVGFYARVGTLLNGGEFEARDGCKNIRFTMEGSSKDLEGSIRIGTNCESIKISIGDSFDTTGKLFVGDNCTVDVWAGSDVRGTIVVGKNSTVIVSYDGDTEGLSTQKGAGSTLDLKKR